MTRPHTFSGNRLDRAERERRDPDWIARRERDPASVFLPLRRLDVLVREAAATRLDWRTGRWLAEMRVDGPRYLLGLSGGVAHFAVDVSDHPGDLDQDREQRFAELREAAVLLPAAEAGIAAQARAGGRLFAEVRGVSPDLPLRDTAILAQARSLVDWHARHRYCSVCGRPTAPQRGGQSRRCGHCDAEHFPRTDPVVIVVVSDGDRCLLGQSRGRLSSQRMFSALAGFMDQGESIEEAVRREVAEEAGVQVGEVRYHSSQPWPFPSSLMIGCHADALTVDLRPDDVEMQAVHWFDRPTVLRALAGQDPELRVPGKFAIAHHLIRAWAIGEV